MILIDFGSFFVVFDYLVHIWIILIRFRTDFYYYFDDLSELAADFFRNKKFFWHLGPCGIGWGPLIIAFPRFLGKSYGQAHYANENIEKSENIERLSYCG